MQQTELFLLFTAPLEKAGIVYMVGGSVASMVYGEPRLTNDIDIVVRKLEYFREGASEKHVHDIQGMLAASGDVLDGQALDVWIQRLALDKVWDDVRRKG